MGQQAPPSIVITGASGFVGQNVVDALIARGHSVAGLTRGGERERGVGWRRVDYGSVEDLEAAVAGAETVIHLAGRAHIMRGPAASNYEEFEEANAGVTSRLAIAAGRAGVQRLIFVSSVGAVASSSEQRLSGREARPDTAYGRSKLAAEHVLKDALRGSGVGVVILRPPMIFGPAMRGNPLRLFELVRRGVPLPFGAIHNSRSILFVENLAAAIVRLAETEPMSLTSFVRDDEEPSTPELVRAIADALQVPARLWPLPPRILRAAGAIGDRLPDVVPYPLSHAAAVGLTRSLLVDASPLTESTGFLPPVSLAEGLRKTAEWCERQLRGPRLRKVPMFSQRS